LNISKQSRVQALIVQVGLTFLIQLGWQHGYTLVPYLGGVFFVVFFY